MLQPTPPPRSPRLSLRLGALLIAVWALGASVIVALGLPRVWVKLVLLACAAIWAIHVAHTLTRRR